MKVWSSSLGCGNGADASVYAPANCTIFLHFFVFFWLFCTKTNKKRAFLRVFVNLGVRNRLSRPIFIINDRFMIVSVILKAVILVKSLSTSGATAMFDDILVNFAVLFSGIKIIPCDMVFIKCALGTNIRRVFIHRLLSSLSLGVSLTAYPLLYRWGFCFVPISSLSHKALRPYR